MTLDMEETLKALMKMFDHPHQWYGGRTYAQHGDDLAIVNLFHCLHVERPSYLDIGAHHPFHLSNTALLYQRGSRGVNVEANPDLIENFRKFRPEDVNVCAAVVDTPGQGTVFLNRLDRDSGLNSLLPIAGLRDRVRVRALTATEVVKEYAGGVWPDLLTIDAEGMDVKILGSIDYALGGPRVICAEAVSQTGDACAELRELMTKNGYEIHSFAGSNVLLVRADLMGMCR